MSTAHIDDGFDASGHCEQRRAARSKVCIAGEVSDGDKRQRQGCTVVDISSTGARLYLCPSNERGRCRKSRVNCQVGLFLTQEHVAVECQVVWSANDEIGVRFCTPFQRSAALS